MSEWKLKRFWTKAEVAPVDGGFTVTLDGRGVKTPAKQQLVAPTEALAAALATEWAAQEEAVNPETMPLTRLTNSALDKVTVQHDAVAQMLAEYGSSDLLCYRADGPEALIQRQADAWDGLLAWADQTHGVALHVQTGLMPVPQPEASEAAIARLTGTLDPFTLTAFHELVSLSGSWVIGYAVLTGAYPAEELWTAALVDELWQEEQWGADEEAQEARAVKRSAFLLARDFANLSGIS